MNAGTVGAANALTALEREVDRWGSELLLSTDLFDTLLLRDRSTETGRQAEAMQGVAAEWGVDPVVLTRLRWDLQVRAYQSVALERPHGEASLERICETLAVALRLGEGGAEALRHREISVDIRHLRPNTRLMRVLVRALEVGVRLVAISDTYYSETDLRRIIDGVVGSNPFAAIYSSADIGLTKHAGGLFSFVARREAQGCSHCLHVGDNRAADVNKAVASSWQALHMPRTRTYRATRRVMGLSAVPMLRQRKR